MLQVDTHVYHVRPRLKKRLNYLDMSCYPLQAARGAAQGSGSGWRQWHERAMAKEVECVLHRMMDRVVLMNINQLYSMLGNAEF